MNLGTRKPGAGLLFVAGDGGSPTLRPWAGLAGVCRGERDVWSCGNVEEEDDLRPLFRSLDKMVEGAIWLICWPEAVTPASLLVIALPSATKLTFIRVSSLGKLPNLKVAVRCRFGFGALSAKY